jgi:two-component system C4-dicarboxylate transport sensor histidine kinase DctB
VTDSDALVVSASNYDQPDSFVGENFSFRPYFTDALTKGNAEYHGAGAISGRPGLFFARRIGSAADPLGIVVVKFEFAALAALWANDPGRALLVDPEGIILASSDAADVMRVLSPLSDEARARIAKSRLYPDATLEVAELDWPGTGEARGPYGERLIVAELPIPGTRLRLLQMLDAAPGLAAARERAWVLALPAFAGLMALGTAMWWWFTRAARAAAYRRTLEEAVTERTLALEEQMAERERADRRYRDAREELAQANRLASLGTITAGLVHEINQPVATIRTLAENARHHLEAGRLDRVGDGLDSAVELTARIGAITQEMRQFARGGGGEVTSVSLDEVMAGAMLLVGDRIRKLGVDLSLPPSLAPSLAEHGQPAVLANRIRLEQVLVNVLQNALDALAGRPDPRIEVTVSRAGDRLNLTVADNGPGIAPELADRIFDPFVTGRSGGLGLGLGIARDIMRELGGGLEPAPSPLGGAAFVISMRCA